MFVLIALFASSLPALPEPPATVVLTLGAAGQSEYASNFLHQAELWEKACIQAGCERVTVGADPSSTNDLELLKQTLEAQPKEALTPLWLVFIGHGTFDGKEARFNLRGPDISATDLAQWLKPFHRPLVFVDCSSSSAPFLNKLSGTNRVIITATRSGNEQYFTRFGQYFAAALTDPQADLDKDGQVSLLETFLTASRQTAEFYKMDGRIATEHALLDDNGDGLGTPADWFQGLRAVKKPQSTAAVDGLLARQITLVPSKEERNLTTEQRAYRDDLERAVFLLREKKSKLPEDGYYRELEKLLLKLANFYNSTSGTALIKPLSQPVSRP
jgi:hypothetical protein